jgi:hypothetical protein
LLIGYGLDVDLVIPSSPSVILFRWWCLCVRSSSLLYPVLCRPLPGFLLMKWSSAAAFRLKKTNVPTGGRRACTSESNGKFTTSPSADVNRPRVSEVVRLDQCIGCVTLAGRCNQTNVFDPLLAQIWVSRIPHARMTTT